MKPVRIPLASLDSDGRTLVEVGGTEIVVFLVDGEARAFENACPHEGNPLCEGEIRGDTLTCAFHGWKFDLATGACIVGGEPARTFSAEVQGGEIVVTA